MTFDWQRELARAGVNGAGDGRDGPRRLRGRVVAAALHDCELPAAPANAERAWILSSAGEGGTVETAAVRAHAAGISARLARLESCGARMSPSSSASVAGPPGCDFWK